MAKIIKYKFLSCEVNHGTEENPNIEQIILDVKLICQTQEEFDNSYPVAEKEAVGEIIVEGEFDHETENESTIENRVEVLEETSATKEEVQAVWDSMAAAYNEGVQNA